MSIEKYYEIGCDVCGNAQHFQGNVALAENQYRSYGGIVTQNKKHYCDKDCYCAAKTNESEVKE